MSVPALLLLCSASLYTGFQWTVRVVVYPQFARVPAGGFMDYERHHQQLASRAVGPLFVFFGVSAIVAFAVRPGFTSAAAGSCLALVLVLTAFVAVPLHRRLSAGFDSCAHRALLRTDTTRLALSVLACVAAVGYALTP